MSAAAPIDLEAAMMIQLILIALLASAAAIGLIWFMTDWSRRADNVRRHSQKDAETIDSLRFNLENRAALPMHDRSFDPPRKN